MSTWRHLKNDAFSRQMKTYYRNWALESFGGHEWMCIIIAIGTIDNEIVTAVNNIIQGRLCANAGWQKLQRSGRPYQTLKGLQHKQTDVKTWMSTLRHLKNDGFTRQMKTYYRKWALELFGGHEWMCIIIAIGTIDDVIVRDRRQ